MILAGDIGGTNTRLALFDAKSGRLELHSELTYPTREQGNRAVIAAGTGLGEAGLFWDGASHRPMASEGGHADFAPRTAIEIELLQFLTRKFGRVSYERILSGPGLHNVYEFLRDGKREPEPAWLA